MQKRWKILEADALRTTALKDALKINRTLCGILVQRGYDNFEKTKQYFRPELTDLHDPWLMKDMRKAVTRIINAFAQKEKILVFGDYVVLLNHVMQTSI